MRTGGEVGMSIKNGVWHDAKLDPPGAEHINRPVLVVRETSTRKCIDFAIYSAWKMRAPSCTWEGTWNKKGNVLYWMPLPEIPEN